MSRIPKSPSHNFEKIERLSSCSVGGALVTQSVSDRILPGSLLGPKGSPNHKICPLPDQQGALVRTAGERMEK